MQNYARISNQNKVTEIIRSTKPLNQPGLIAIGDYSSDLLGAFYDQETKTFVGKKDKTSASILVSTTPAATNNRVTVAEGTTVSLSIEVRDSDGNVLPLSDTFAVPVRRIGGAVERTVGISFTDGVASKDITWPSSGEFEITKDLINMHLPPEQHFKFERLVFSVYE